MASKTIDPFGLLAFLPWNSDWNNYHFDEKTLTKAISQLKDLGIPMIRMDILWNEVQEHPVNFDFKKYDHIISELAKNKIEILAILHYNRPGPGEKREEVWNTPPKDYDEFAHYVRTTVDRYKSTIRFWEIWNEPNMDVYWATPKEELKPYCRLLEKSYKACKEADPTCTVLNGGITTPLFEDVSNFYNNGGKDLTDILNVHTFINPLIENPLQEFDRLITGIRDIMVKHGDTGKKIWITEMGCPGVPQDVKSPTWFAGDSMGEEKQAEWLEEIFDAMKKYPYVEKLFWAFYRDTNGEFNDATDHLGLVRFDLTPKPAFDRFKGLIRNFSKR